MPSVTAMLCCTCRTLKSCLCNCTSCLSALWRRYPLCCHVCLLWCVTHMLVLPLTTHNLRWSDNYISEDVAAMSKAAYAVNTARIHAANTYLNKLGVAGVRDVLRAARGDAAHQRVDIAISIITVRRNGIDSYNPRYLTQIVWKFTSLLEKAKRENTFNHTVQLSICNVDIETLSFKEGINMSLYVDTFRRFNKSKLLFDHRLEKEKRDYVYCMNETLRLYKPRYVFLVEDDALPNDDLFVILDHFLRTRLDQQYSDGELLPQGSPQNIAYVKFYHPERFLDYDGLEPDRLLEQISLGVIFGLPLTAMYRGMFKSRHRVWVLWVVFTWFMCQVFDSIGKAHIVAARRLLTPHLYYYGPAPSCCTPAMMFPEAGARAVSDYLTAVTCHQSFGKDMAIEQFIGEGYWKAKYVQPNVFQHIGMYSAVNHGIMDPRNI